MMLWKLILLPFFYLIGKDHAVKNGWCQKVKPSPPPRAAPNSAPKPAPKPKPPKKKRTDGPKIVFSYQLNEYTHVKFVQEKLFKAGYRSWPSLDSPKEAGKVGVDIPKTIRSSVLVVPVLTKSYQNSPACQKEIQFADKCKKALIPIRIERGFRPGEDWLGFLLGTRVWYDLSKKETFDEQFANFLHTISLIGKDAKMPPEEEEEPPPLPTLQPINSEAMPQIQHPNTVI
ncbi:uncharacterized protein [Watersipora subatra]|uniref:uncharacterized protein n=1 Tax=Watersipora subatra TaxID=2589382 RepID=UPI00355AFD28